MTVGPSSVGNDECGGSSPSDTVGPASRADGQEKGAGALRWIVCPNGDHFDERASTFDDEGTARRERDRLDDGEKDEEWGIILLYPRPAAVPEAKRTEVPK